MEQHSLQSCRVVSDVKHLGRTIKSLVQNSIGVNVGGDHIKIIGKTEEEVPGWHQGQKKGAKLAPRCFTWDLIFQ